MAGEGGDNFADLLHQIASEHQRIVGRLQSENTDLKTRLGNAQRTQMSAVKDASESESAPRPVDQGHPRSVRETVSNSGAILRESLSPEPQEERTLIKTQVPSVITSEGSDCVELRTKEKTSYAARGLLRRRTLDHLDAIAESIERQETQSDKHENPDLPRRCCFRHKVHWLVNLEGFELAVVALILLTTFVMATEMQYNGMQAGYELRIPGRSEPASRVWPAAADIFDSSEQAFTVVFVMELALRLYGDGWQYLLSVPNWVDIVVVIFSVLDWLLQAVTPTGSVKPPLIRLLRLVRLLKGIRILANFISVLKLLLSSIAASFSTLCYSLCLVVLIQIVSAMLMVQLLSSYINDTTKPEDERREIYRYWGTFTFAYLTMFEVTFANWGPACRALVNFVHEGYAVFFYLYRCVVGLAVLMVVNAVFIQKTLEQAQNNQAHMIAKQQQDAERQRQKLAALFRSLDQEGDGQLTREDFEIALGHPRTASWFKAMQVDVSDVETLIEVMNLGDGSIDIHEFTANMTRIKGTAKSMDLLQVLSIGREVRTLLRELIDGLGDKRHLLGSPALQAPALPGDTTNHISGECHHDEAFDRETEQRIGAAASFSPVCLVARSQTADFVECQLERNGYSL